MNQPRTILVAALLGLGFAVTGFSLTASNGTARAEAGQTDFVVARIDMAFSVAPDFAADPAVEAAAARQGKGDLLVSPACVGQSWPQIAPDCLVAADGASVRPVRSVTIGYQAGEASTVLVRMPAPQIASR